jgi:hypothetical protein
MTKPVNLIRFVPAKEERLPEETLCVVGPAAESEPVAAGCLSTLAGS